MLCWVESEEGVCEAEAGEQVENIPRPQMIKKFFFTNIVYLIELCTSDEMREERILYLFQSSGAAQSNSAF